MSFSLVPLFGQLCLLLNTSILTVHLNAISHFSEVPMFYNHLLTQMTLPGFATITIGTSKAAQDLELASFFETLGIQSECQRMIGMSNHLLSIVSRSHDHSQKVIGSLGRSWAALKDSSHIDHFRRLRQSWIAWRKLENFSEDRTRLKQHVFTAVVDLDTFSANGKPFNFWDCTI